MITSLVEPGGARPGDATRRVVILTMFAYTALAALFAGAASIGAGLGILALGMLFTLLIDMRQWRDIVAHDLRHSPPEPARVALPRRDAPRAIAAPTSAPMRAITTTRLLPYVRPEVAIEAISPPAAEPAIPADEPSVASMPPSELEPEAVNTPKPRRKTIKHKTSETKTSKPKTSEPKTSEPKTSK